MEIIGKIITVAPIERGNSSRGPWSRATIVVEYESGQYPKTIALQNSRDAENFARLQIGQIGKFFFDTKTREFNGKYYTDINCWKWEIQNSQTSSNAPVSGGPF